MRNLLAAFQAIQANDYDHNMQRMQSVYDLVAESSINFIIQFIGITI